MKLIIAGSYQQYLDYIIANGLSTKDTKYIDCTEKATGYSVDTEVVFTGTWKRHKINESYIHALFDKVIYDRI